MTNKVYSKQIAMVGNDSNSFLSIASNHKNSKQEVWSWGDDNLLPNALALMARRTTIHRRIINDKSDYISGKGINADPKLTTLNELICCCNAKNESLRQVINRVVFDKVLFGNGFMEVVTDDQGSFLSLYHQDASKCRVAKDNKHIVLNNDWQQFDSKKSLEVALYPEFSTSSDGMLHSIIHYKDYEPTFKHYGVPQYIAGMNVSTIAYKTDQWNINRLDNSFQLSGVMMLDATTDSDEETAKIIKAAEKRFAGKPGQIMFIMKDGSQGDSSKFIPINAQNDGDWESLHSQSTSDIIVAHSWFRSLSGLDYNSSFSAERILNEYEVALNTIILAEQEDILEPIRDAIVKTLKVDGSSLQIINKPPTTSKQPYMKVWEARKNDGLDYDPEEPAQQQYLAQISIN